VTGLLGYGFGAFGLWRGLSGHRRAIVGSSAGVTG
jgi:hypothetical protein